MTIFWGVKVGVKVEVKMDNTVSIVHFNFLFNFYNIN